MMHRFIKSIILFICLSIPFASNAWGVLGHRIVGEIADGYLTKKTKRELVKILGNESVSAASNWPDFIKSDPSYRYLNNWHYVNLPSGLDEGKFSATLIADTSTNAFTKVNFMVKELKTNKLMPQQTKQMYVRLLIHIIGDLHQPLHLGRVDDKGGNDVKLKWFSEDVNLHSLWDSKLVEFQKLCYSEYVRDINFSTKDERKKWQEQTFTQWLFETYTFTEKIYAQTKAGERLDYEYNFKFIAPMNEQLLKGGVRLAGVLNDIFK